MSLRERLDAKSRPTAKYQLLIDQDGAEAAEEELSAARAELPLVLLAGDEARIQAVRDRVTAAQQAYKACFEKIVFTALPADDFEALIELPEHKPRDGTDDEIWNGDTLPRAAFLACAPDVYTAEEWEAWLADRVNDAERLALYSTAVNANSRTPDPSVPKGWTETLS